LKVRKTILVLSTLVIAACGESTPWPPHQAESVHVFNQQKATFMLIEREMAADGLRRMAPAIFSETSRSPAVATLPTTQSEKYAALFDSTRMYLYVTRMEQSTSFEMLIQNVGPRLYLSRFIHTSAANWLPNCAPAMRQNACGTCSVPLAPDWLLEYNWFPADPDEEAREC
jgi:hypothetical protein